MLNATRRRVLVLGGTGLLGAPVTRRLQADGFAVRVLSRDPEHARRIFGASVEVVAGDVGDPTTLRRAFEDCWGVHVSVAGPLERASAESAAALARAHGLARISYVSGSTVDERNRWFPMVAAKLAAERSVETSGVAWTVFRPTWPFETLARFVRAGRATVIGKHRKPYHWFSADDFARMVSAAFTTDGTTGTRLYVHGPEALTMHEALDRYRAALHPDITTVSTLPTWMGRLLAAVTRNEQLRFASELMAYFDRVEELGDPSEANRLLGAPTTTLDAWLETRKAGPTSTG